MKTVALLGGSRFVGYHLLLALLRKGHEVTLFNRGFTRPPVPFPNNIRIVNGDRNNPQDMSRLFKHDFDVVFDLSGYNPDHMKPIINNYQSQIGHYIYCSSASVYENLMDPQLKEESPCTLNENTYGRNKALAENLLMDQYKKNISTQADEITNEIIMGKISDLDTCSASAVGLYSRYLKRIAAHSRNIISSVVNPFERIGYPE